MKKSLLLIVFVLLSIFQLIHAQSIEQLQIERKKIETDLELKRSEINVLNNKLNQLDSKVKELELSEINEIEGFQAITNDWWFIKDEQGKELGRIEKGEKVLLLKYVDNGILIKRLINNQIGVANEHRIDIDNKDEVLKYLASIKKDIDEKEEKKFIKEIERNRVLKTEECNYVVNEIDAFTGKVRKQTIKKYLSQTSGFLSYSINRAGSNYNLYLSTSIDGCAVTDKSYLSIKFSDGSKETLYHKSDIDCSGEIVLNISNQLKNLISKNIELIRIGLSEGYKDIKIDAENSTFLKRSIECVD